MSSTTYTSRTSRRTLTNALTTQPIRSSSLPRSSKKHDTTLLRSSSSASRHTSPPPTLGRHHNDKLNTNTISTTPNKRKNDQAELLSELPHSSNAYKTYTTIDDSSYQQDNDQDNTTTAATPIKPKKSVSINASLPNLAERKARFYRLLRSLHIHADEASRSSNDIIFPPGFLLTGENDWQTFLLEFTALSATHNRLLMLSVSQPVLMISLNEYGKLESYNRNPEAFMGITLKTMKELPYTKWFDESYQTTSHSYVTSTNSPAPENPFHAFRNSKNAQLLTSISLCFNSREAVREEHCMFSGGRDRPTPITLTAIPVLNGTISDQNSSFETLDWLEQPFRRTTTQSANASHANNEEDDIKLNQHAFSGLDAEAAKMEKQRQHEKQLATEASLEQARLSSLRGVTLLIEDKEKIWQLNQRSKDIKRQALETIERRRSKNHSINSGPAVFGDESTIDIAANARRSQAVVQPKLDTNIGSALALMEQLAKLEKSNNKRKMYREIIAMLSSSKAQESVNEGVILQLEESEAVNADLKDWLIKQINPAGPGQPQQAQSTDINVSNQSSDGQSNVEGVSASEDRVSGTVTTSAVSSPQNRKSGPNDRQSVLIGDSSPTQAAAASLGSPVFSNEMPSALFSKPVDDAQFVDASPQVSLLARKSKVGGPPVAGVSRKSVAPQSHTTPPTPSTRNDAQTAAEPKVARGRQSLRKLSERKSMTSLKAAASLSVQPHGSNFTSPRALDTPHSSRVRPAGPTASLPLLELRVERKPSPNDSSKGSDARIRYFDHQIVSASNTGSLQSSPSAAELSKQSVFKAVGCVVPEVHHNAQFDVNSQPLFWSSLWLSLQPDTQSRTNQAGEEVPGDGALTSRHQLLHPRLQFSEQQGASLARTLASMSVWNEFNIFHLSTHSQGWPLTFTFTSIMTQLNLIGKWGVDAELCSNFIREIERGYFANPYHSSTHAADVLQHCYHTITQTHLALSLSDLDLFLLFVAAAVHDYGHPGVSNQYLTTTLSPLSLQYNDKNVLENYHVAAAFLLMQSKPDCNILAHMDTATFKKARKMLIELVLATDLAAHFEILAVWKRKEATIDVNKDEDKLLVMQMILKSGDLGHPSRVRHLHLTWSELITEEFFQQGDRERALGLPVNKMLDRHSCNIVESQIGFIEFLVMPIYEGFVRYMGNDMYHTLVKANLTMWQRLNAETAEIQAAKEAEEHEYRRAAEERQQQDTLKSRELSEAEEAKLRSAAEFESELALHEQAERDAALAAQTSAQVESESEDQEVDLEEELILPKLVAPIIDMRLQRENDDWLDGQADDSDMESEEDDSSDTELQRRRAVKEAALQAQRQAADDLRRRERAARLETEREAHTAEHMDMQEVPEADGNSWFRSREQEELEIEERKIQLAKELHRQKRKRGTTAAVTQSPQLAAITPLEPRPLSGTGRRPSLLARVDVDKVFQSLASRSRTSSAAGRDSDLSNELDDNPLDTSESSSSEEYENEYEDSMFSEEEKEELVAGAAEDDGSLVQASRDLQDAKPESNLHRISSDHSQARDELNKSSSSLDVTAPSIVSETERQEELRLEQKVRRVLERERLKRAHRQSAVVSDAHLEGYSDLFAARLNATRAVSLLLTDKEWGIHRPLHEERAVYLEYLKQMDALSDVSSELDDALSDDSNFLNHTELSVTAPQERQGHGAMSGNGRSRKVGQRVRLYVPDEEEKDQMDEPAAQYQQSWSATEEWHSDEEDESVSVGVAHVDTRPKSKGEVDAETSRRRDLKNAVRAQLTRASQDARGRFDGRSKGTRSQSDGSTVSFPPLAAAMTRASSHRTKVPEVITLTEPPNDIPVVHVSRSNNSDELTLSRALVPSKPRRVKLDQLDHADWREDDAAAMQMVLRKVIPRTKQAELERYRKHVLAKMRADM